MRIMFVLSAAALVSAGAACYQTTAPPPSTGASTTTTTSGTVTTTSGDVTLDAGVRPYDSDYDNEDRAGRSPGQAPPGVGITGAPMGRPQPWRGAGGCRSR